MKKDDHDDLKRAAPAGGGDTPYATSDVPEYLYFGVPFIKLLGIEMHGLKGRDGEYIPLVNDRMTAMKSVKGKSNPVILTIKARKMQSDGCQFIRKDADTWLTKEVERLYIFIEMNY